MLALVTGATGFLGRCVATMLREHGYAVRGFVRRPDSQLRERGVELCVGDLRDPNAVNEAVRNVEVVMHTAALAGVWGPFRDYYDVNVLGTHHVIRACQSRGVRQLVFTSSPSVTFSGTDQLGVDESVPYASRWLAYYPQTKAMAEQAVLAADEPGGLRTCALRPHLIWGPGDRHLIPRLLHRARQGQLRRIGDGTNRIDTIFIDDAARAHLLASQALDRRAASAGKAYFLSQGEPVNCWDWIGRVLSIAGLPPIQRSISGRQAWIAGCVLEAVYRGCRLPGEPRMTRFLARQLSTSHYFNIAAARRDLGYQPQVDPEEGLRRLAAEFARHRG